MGSLPYRAAFTPPEIGELGTLGVQFTIQMSKKFMDDVERDIYETSIQRS